MKFVNKLNQRVCRLNHAIEDFQKILNREDVKKQLDIQKYVQQKLESVEKKRNEYLICIQAIIYLENHLEKSEFEKVLTIYPDTID
jgi:hypothetical protein